MKALVISATLAAFVAPLTACDSTQPIEDVEHRSLEGCDHEAIGDITVDFDAGVLTVTDESGRELAGVICIDAGAQVLGEHATIDEAPPGDPLMGGVLGYKPPDSGDGFSCSCVDFAGIHWTQSCSDPPHYGCTQCCDANGGDTTHIKLKPACVWNIGESCE